MTEELTVDVPLVAIGESAPSTSRRHAAPHPSRRVKVRALPDHLPQSIEYRSTSLVDFEVTVHVRDLTIPAT